MKIKDLGSEKDLLRSEARVLEEFLNAALHDLGIRRGGKTFVKHVRRLAREERKAFAEYVKAGGDPENNWARPRAKWFEMLESVYSQGFRRFLDK